MLDSFRGTFEELNLKSRMAKGKRAKARKWQGLALPT